MRVIKIIKSLFKKKEKLKSRQYHNIFNKIQGIELNQLELKAWLHNDTALKITRLLKIQKASLLEGLLHNPENKDIIIGRCKGYEDIIELFEESIRDKEATKDLLGAYIDTILINV